MAKMRLLRSVDGHQPGTVIEVPAHKVDRYLATHQAIKVRAAGKKAKTKK